MGNNLDGVKLDNIFRGEEPEPRDRSDDIEPAEHNKDQKSKKRRAGLGKKRVIIAIIVALAFVGVCAFAFIKWQEAEYLRSPEGIAETSKRENKELVTAVSGMINLPNEEPTIATVEDKDKLKGNPFFEEAENGDKVLIYPTASKAFIYRQSENRIINSGPIALTADNAEATSDATSEPNAEAMQPGIQ